MEHEKKGVDYLEYIRERVPERKMLEELARTARDLSDAAIIMRAASSIISDPSNCGAARERLQEALSKVETWVLLLGYNSPFMTLNRECIRREMLVELAAALSEKEVDHEVD